MFYNRAYVLSRGNYSVNVIPNKRYYVGTRRSVHIEQIRLAFIRDPGALPETIKNMQAFVSTGDMQNNK